MSDKLTGKEIVKLLDNLIGPVEAIGETNADERIYKNLQTLIDVTNWCLDGIHQSSFTCGRSEYSMHKVGYDAKCALGEYRMWLDDVCGEVQE